MKQENISKETKQTVCYDGSTKTFHGNPGTPGAGLQSSRRTSRSRHMPGVLSSRPCRQESAARTILRAVLAWAGARSSAGSQTKTRRSRSSSTTHASFLQSTICLLPPWTPKRLPIFWAISSSTASSGPLRPGAARARRNGGRSTRNRGSRNLPIMVLCPRIGQRGLLAAY